MIADESHILHGPYEPEGELGWRCVLPSGLEAWRDNTIARPYQSRLALSEDGRPLKAGRHALIQDIREKGGGRYNNLTDHLYFSTSDASDPNLNGRPTPSRATPPPHGFYRLEPATRRW